MRAKVCALAVIAVLAPTLWAGVSDEALSTEAGKQLEKAYPLAAKKVKMEVKDSKHGIGFALGVLFKRLFELEDKHRELENWIGYDKKELGFQCSLFRIKHGSYSKKSDEKLIEISEDPEHREYPRNTDQRVDIDKIRKLAVKSEGAELEIKRVAGSIKDVKEMIDKMVQRIDCPH